MSKEEPYRDQADKLKQRIEKYKEPELEETETSLPPRSELHRNKKKKTKVKLKFPLIRILALFFILLPITIFSIYTYLENKHIGTEKTTVPSKGYETINFEKSKSKQTKQSTNGSDQKKETKQEKNNTGSTLNNDNSTEQNNSPQDQSIISTQTENGSDKNVNSTSTGGIQQNTPGVQTIESATQTGTNKIAYHTVQKGETLYSIAMYYYHSGTGIQTIKTANKLRTDNITKGQVIKIPLSVKPIK